MDEGAVSRIARLGLEAGTKVVELKGESYLPVNMTRVKPFEPLCEPFSVWSLQGLVDFVLLNRDGFDWRKHLVHVTGPRTVAVVSTLMTEDRLRETPVGAAVTELEEFRFGSYIAHEEFLVRLASLFERTDDQEGLLSYTAAIDMTEKAEIRDDGITQETLVRKGVSGAIREIRAPKPFVHLRPYRTFRELEQPESVFLFRMRAAGKEVSCALFEADGGRWKLEALSRVAEWLRERLPEDLPVIV